MFNYNYFGSMKSFYDALAPDYDEMTGFDDRFENEAAVFNEIIRRYSIKSALDAGAGTGFHSLILAKLGVQVTAVDISSKMIDRLRQNARRLDLSVHTVVSDFENISNSVNTTFDAVLCLGNSFVHLLTDNALEKTLSNFYSLLKPGGVLLIQILNYDKIMKERKRIQNIKKRGNTRFVRLYDYCNERLFFNILKLTDTDTETDHSIQTVELRPLRKVELADFLKNTGFTRVEHYGSLSFEPFTETGSSNLVTVAQR
jgi:glycine/sarcosine N-methyltransferase